MTLGPHEVIGWAGFRAQEMRSHTGPGAEGRPTREVYHSVVIVPEFEICK